MHSENIQKTFNTSVFREPLILGVFREPLILAIKYDKDLSTCVGIAN